MEGEERVSAVMADARPASSMLTLAVRGCCSARPHSGEEVDVDEVNVDDEAVDDVEVLEPLLLVRLCFTA